MQTLSFNEFLRSLKQNKDTVHSMLLGAGASIESGMPSATDCIWDWKHDIFLSQNPSVIEHFKNIKINNVKTSVQNWLDIQNIYPANGSDDEYSYYAEKSYPIAEDRRKYFQTLTYGKTPSIGYHLICMLAEENLIKNIWTTNFDGLMLKAAHNYDLIPIEVTLESQQRVFRNDVNKEILCIELHGDYKYGDLKNTESELDTQDDKFIEALQHELKNRNLIVIGYSGRDKSLMSALETAYTQQGAGRLYWCGYGETCPKPVENLLNSITRNGRYGFYIPCDGFDKTMLDISQFSMSENKEFINKVEVLKKNICNEKDFITTDFTSVQGNLSKIVGSNLYPISFPKNCYQFKIKFKPEENPWNYCKSLIKYSIVAIYNDGYIYAFGSKAKIQSICADKIIGEITISPITKDLIKGNGNFQKLLINTITISLAKTNNLNCSNNVIWDTSNKLFHRIKNQIIYAFSGVELSLVFDNKYTYISLIPSYYFEDKPLFDKESKKIFADYFSKKINTADSNQTKPNINIYHYLQNWKKKVIGDHNQTITFPNGSSDGFNFIVRANSALVGINKNTNYSINISKNIDRRIIFSGTECSDPELIFYNSNTKTFENDFHPMRGLINNKPYDYIISKQILKSEIKLGVICPDSNDDKKLYDFLNKLNQNHKANLNVDYVLPFTGFYNAFDLALNIPLVNSKYWVHTNELESVDLEIASRKFAESISQKIDCLSATETDVIIIYIPKSYEWLTSYKNSNSKFDLHNYIKAYAAQKNISTQFIRENTIESDSKLYCQIMWALSLALYVKSGHIPFTISGLQQDTAFAGIGYSVNTTENNTDVVIGCSHIYSYDGQGLKYKLSKINDNGFFLDKKKNPYLSESEAYKLGLGIKDLFYKSFSELPKRVVIHKRTPFKQVEIDGLVKSLSSSGITQIDLLEINYEEKIKCFEYDKKFNIDFFPIRRGLVFPQNKNTIQLYTHGIAPSVRNPNYKYFQGGKTLPKPLKIVKHYGCSNMQQIASEILGLSKMNWNSFGLYSKLPCTLESANAVARIGSLLSEYEGSMYDYRFFM